MRKFFVRVMVCGLLAAAVWCYMLIRDHQKLTDSMIRFHVVANSDSPEDQAIKLIVRDAVLESIQKDLTAVSDVSSAKEYLSDNLPRIREIVRQTLCVNGSKDRYSVSLCKERFDVRHYDTFSLPAGVYDSLRIIIGNGEGHNWWCVSFPSLCVPATSAEFEDAAVGAGFSHRVVKSLVREESGTIRFYLLDRIGKLENIFFRK